MKRGLLFAGLGKKYTDFTSIDNSDVLSALQKVKRENTRTNSFRFESIKIDDFIIRVRAPYEDINYSPGYLWNRKKLSLLNKITDYSFVNFCIYELNKDVTESCHQHMKILPADIRFEMWRHLFDLHGNAKQVDLDVLIKFIVYCKKLKNLAYII